MFQSSLGIAKELPEFCFEDTINSLFPISHKIRTKALVRTIEGDFTVDVKSRGKLAFQLLC